MKRMFASTAHSSPQWRHRLHPPTSHFPLPTCRCNTTATSSTAATSQQLMSFRWIFIVLALSSSFLQGQQYSISTVAGGAPPSTPATGTSTSIGPPRQTATASGNIYFSSLNSVFQIDSNGVLTLVAGTAKPGYSGDGGPAVNAQLNTPQGVAVDGSGNI